MSIFAPDAFPAWLRVILFWVGVALLAWGVAAAIWHFRPRGWVARHVLWRFRLKLPAFAPDLASIEPSPAITPTSHKGKPLVRLTEPERERVSRALLAAHDYMANDFERVLQPLRDILAYQNILRKEGGAAYHRMVEAVRPQGSDPFGELINAMEPYRSDLMLVESVHFDGINSKAPMIWRALGKLSDVTQLLPPDTANGTALELPIGHYREVLDSVSEEVSRVKSEIQRWRLKISKGELG